MGEPGDGSKEGRDAAAETFAAPCIVWSPPHSMAPCKRGGDELNIGSQYLLKNSPFEKKKKNKTKKNKKTTKTKRKKTKRKGNTSGFHAALQSSSATLRGGAHTRSLPAHLEHALRPPEPPETKQQQQQDDDIRRRRRKEKKERKKQKTKIFCSTAVS